MQPSRQRRAFNGCPLGRCVEVRSSNRCTTHCAEQEHNGDTDASVAKSQADLKQDEDDCVDDICADAGGEPFKALDVGAEGAHTRAGAGGDGLEWEQR